MIKKIIIIIIVDASVILQQIFTAFIKGDEPIPSWFVKRRTVLIPKKGDCLTQKTAGLSECYT